LLYFPAVPVSLVGQAANERLTSQNLQELYRGASQGDQHPSAPHGSSKAPEAALGLGHDHGLSHSRQPEIRTTSRAPRSPEFGI